MQPTALTEPQANGVKQVFIDSRELAQRMGRSERYVQHLVEKRLIPFLRLPGRSEPKIHRIKVAGRVIERSSRAGQLFFSWDKVVEALMKYEVAPEPQPGYRRRRVQAAS